jgi:hypothetical protein
MGGCLYIGDIMFKTRIEAVYLGYKNGLEDYMKQDGEWKWASVTLSVPIIAEMDMPQRP